MWRKTEKLIQQFDCHDAFARQNNSVIELNRRTIINNWRLWHGKDNRLGGVYIEELLLTMNGFTFIIKLGCYVQLPHTAYDDRKNKGTI